MRHPPDRAAAQLLELVPDIVYEYRLSPPPGFVYVSASVTDVVGYTPEEHYADPDLGRRIVHPDDLGRLEAIVARPDERTVHAMRWRAKWGTEVRIAQRLRIVRDEHGEPVSLIGVGRPLTQADPAWSVTFGDVELDLASGRLTVDGRSVALTPSEQQILALLAAAGRAVPRREIVERLWGVYHDSGDHAVEVHVSNLRKKLEADPRRPRRLVTVRGVGYRLVTGS